MLHIELKYVYYNTASSVCFNPCNRAIEITNTLLIRENMANIRSITQECSSSLDFMTNRIASTEIATLACQQFIQSSAGEISIQFTVDAISLIDNLRQTIWDRLRGKPRAEEAISLVEQGEQKGVEMLAVLLGADMLDEDFATYLQKMVQQINAGKSMERQQ